MNRLAIIVSSVRDGRFAPVVTQWFLSQVTAYNGFEVDVIDLAEVDLPLTFGENSPVADVLDRADAFVVVTPEYNHSYPAAVKNLIDWHFTQWQAKPVGFVSYGGISGGLRAVEHLRGVFAEMHAVTIRDSVSFHGAWERFTEDGTPVDAEAVNAAAKTVLDQLSWWADALREARAKAPYAA